MTLIISSHILRLLQYIRHTHNNTEVSGYISFVQYRNDDNICKSIYTKHPFVSKIDTVHDVPRKRYSSVCRTDSDFKAQIVFHTHPEKCYLDNYVGLGIPSYTDVMTSISGLLEHGQRIQIVVSIEGCYVMYLVGDVLPNKSECMNELHTRYMRIHKDIYTVDVNRREQTIRSFLSNMNTDFYRVLFISGYNDDVQVACKLNKY